MRRALFLTLLLMALIPKLESAVLVLDLTNGRSATVEPGLTVSQSGWSDNSGEIHFAGAVLIYESVEYDYASIGGGAKPGGLTPKDFARDGLEFGLRADGSGNEYTAKLLYYLSPNTGDAVGTAPTPNYNAGAVIEVNPVPEPSAAMLVMVGWALVWRRRRG